MKGLTRLGYSSSPRLTLAIFLSVLQGLSALALLASSAWLLARAAEMPALMYLSIAIVGVRTFALARAALRYAERWLSHDAVLTSQLDLRGRLYRSLVVQVPGTKQLNLGELSSRVVQDIEELPNFSLRVLLPVIQAVLVSAVSIFVFSLMLPGFAWCLTGLLAAAFVLALPISAAISRRADAASAGDRGALLELCRSIISGSVVVGAFRWQSDLLAKLDGLQVGIAKKNAQIARALGASQAVFNFAGQASAVIAAVLGLGQLMSEKSTSMVLLAVFTLLPLGVFDVASGASGAVSNYRRFRASAMRVAELLATTPAPELIGELAPIASIALESATLAYDKTVVEDFSISLKRGDTASLLGPSGSGKTTVGLALAGLIEPKKGRLVINGQKAPNGATVRTRVGYLEQTPSILTGTVRQNLHIAKPSVTDEELIATLVRVQLWRIFEARQGLDTQLGENGVFISGGEAQRLSLARALLADFDVIVLDEPTANLDETQSLHLVRDLVDAATARDRITLLITHDLKLAKLTSRSYWLTK